MLPVKYFSSVFIPVEVSTKMLFALLLPGSKGMWEKMS